jgi:hypothetical protein
MRVVYATCLWLHADRLAQLDEDTSWRVTSMIK